MRFLVDENLSPRLVSLLIDEGHDVLFVPASHLRGSPDSVLHDVAVQEDRIVITRDVRFPVTPALPGIILVRSGNQTPTQLLNLMHDFVVGPSLPTSEGKITVIAPGREPRSRPIPHA
jgi:predicted nuclease of predicted toxin-antitoxin system